MELLTKNSVKTFTSGGITTSKMGVDVESADLLTYYLRDRIYNDKVLAPIREYISNARDEHEESGVYDTPVDVKITHNGNNCLWSVRDYGRGLSEEDIRTVFGIYGKSTKRETNTLVGSFGIGGMSAFSYTDTFYVTSYYQGVKTSYICSLGAGDYGVEVGEIHKISEEPTTESGIEISFDITKNLHSFNSKTSDFVSRFDPNYKIRFQNHNGDIIEPKTPTLIKVSSSMPELNVSLYSNTVHTSRVGIRMGGVCYAYLDGFNFYFRGDVIVDIPIGAMTVPISRESFEDNPSNQKYLKRIRDAIEDMHIEEISNIPQISFLDYVKSLDVHKQYFTDLFCLDLAGAFPNHSNIWKYISMPEWGSKAPILDKDKIVYLFPSIKSVGMWHKRLRKFLSSLPDFVSYCYIEERYYDKISNDIIELGDKMDVVFLDVKKLKLPKWVGEKKGKAYVVTRGGRNNSEYYTPEELEEYVNTHICPVDWDNLSTEFWNTDKLTSTMLHSRTIGLSNVPYDSWRCNSLKFIDEMVELGWLELNSPDYKSALAIIHKKQQEERKLNDQKYWMTYCKWRHYFHPRTMKIIEKNFLKNSKRIEDMEHRLSMLPKTSLRNKLIRQYIQGNWSYSAPDLTRDEFRQLFKL